MRALFLVHNLPDRGSYFRALEIARRFALRGHHVQFAFTSNEKKYRPIYTAVAAPEAVERPKPGPASSRQFIAPATLSPNANFVWAEMPHFTVFNDRQEGWGLPDIFRRSADAARGKWDIVYAFSHKPNCLVPAVLAKACGAKLVLDWSDWWGGGEGLYRQCVIPSNAFQSMPGLARLWRRSTFALDGLLEPHAPAIADAVTLISEEFFKYRGIPSGLESKSYVMHSGSPLDQIKPKDKALARSAIGWSVPNGGIVLGYVANFHMDERLLMDAFARVCDERSDVTLLVVGADLEAATPDIHHRTAGRIHHFGRQPFERIASFLGASDILLLPLTDIALDRARYPHKISDYVAAGRPVIACDVGETGRIFRKFKVGTLAPPNPAAFAHAILNLCADPAAWEVLNLETRAAAEQHFNWDDMCKGLFRFLSAKLGLPI